MTSIQRLTFVWNADFSLAGGIRALKEVAGGYHSCTLCAIAYHRITQTADWKTYTQALTAQYGAQIRQPCRNQLSRAEQAAAAGDYPAVLAHTSAGVVRVLGAKEINACKGALAPFKRKLNAALAAL